MKKCSLCGLNISPTLIDSYCYLHYQIYDSLVYEYNTIIAARGHITWREFLVRKLDVDSADLQIKKIIEQELKSNSNNRL